MQTVDDIIRRAKAFAFDMGGVPALADATGIKVDSLRRLLKDPPIQIKNLRTLEAYMATREELKAPGAPETGGE